MFEFLRIMGWIFGVSLGVGIVMFLLWLALDRMPESWKQPIQVIFWIAVVIGGFYLAMQYEQSATQRKWDSISKNINSTCRGILDEQPNNTDLYDTCTQRFDDVFLTDEFTGDGGLSSAIILGVFAVFVAYFTGIGRGENAGYLNGWQAHESTGAQISKWDEAAGGGKPHKYIKKND